jgi:hypothetical protein
MLREYQYERAFDPDIVVLDFDMSWHKDSLEKDVLFEARDDFAYLAPEQVVPSKLSLSRSTLVDSYGLGMTAFYLFGHAHPQINAYLDSSWPNQIYQAVRRGYEEQWLSAPSRIARMIHMCTSDQQNNRLDFGQIIAELTSIELAIIDYSKLEDARLFSEELMAQLIGADRYSSERQGLRFFFSGPSGVTIESVCDDRRSTVKFSISWLDQGTVERKNIRRYVEEAIDKSATIVANSDWNLKKKDPRLGGVIISAEISVSLAKANWRMAVSSAKNVYRQFNFA